MKKLDQFSSLKLDDYEMNQVKGGFWDKVLIFVAGILVTEWETTKQAAIDAWNGNYNPPK